MNELVQIAQNITKAVSSIVPFSISLSDEHGYLVGATDPDRIGTFHPDSKKVINSGTFLAYEEEEVLELDNVYPGIAVPLVFDHKTVGVIGIIGSPKEVKPYAELIKRYVELMWQESFHKQIEDLESKMEETYLQYILVSEAKNEARILEYSEALGIHTQQQTFCIVIDIQNFLLKEMDEHVFSLTVNNLKRLILQEIKSVFQYGKYTKISFFNTEKIVVIMTVSSVDHYFSIMKEFKENSKKLLNRLAHFEMEEVRISAGKLTDSVFALNESYQEALYLLEHAQNHDYRSPILSLHDWEVFTAFLPSKLAPSYMERIAFELSPLRNDKQFNELKVSFLAYCEENMNITQAASSLYIHRNTLIYRLRKLEKLSQIDTRNFQQCSLLYLVLTANPFS